MTLKLWKKFESQAFTKVLVLFITTRYALFLSEKYRFKIAFDTQKALVNQHITHHWNCLHGDCMGEQNDWRFSVKLRNLYLF